MNHKCTHKTESELTEHEIESDSSMKWVAIREDNLKTIREIGDKLTDKNVLHKIDLAPGCKNGSCALSYILIVPEDQVKSGLLVIDDYFISLHPEFKIAKELEEQGKCPACGFDNGHNVTTCADCGLQLIIEY